MNYTIMNGSYYLLDNETYESGKRIKLAKELNQWYKQKEPQRGYPKVRVALMGGTIILLRDNETADPLLICTQGYIEFVQ
ncbi:MAG: hypothetical protein IJ640_00110 [Prevotella sp.]|nr:hypothetical protein [Prevotella sp.]